MSLSTIGQIIGFVAMGCAFLLPWQKKRSAFLTLKLLCDALWIAHNGLIGAWSGMAISACGIAREFLFLKIPRKKRKPWLLIAMILVGCGSVMTVWQDAWSLFSMLSFTLSCIASWTVDPIGIRAFTFLTSVSQLCYGIHVQSFAGIINECLSMLSITVFFIKSRKTLRLVSRKEHEREIKQK